MTILHTLLAWDTDLFRFINGSLSNGLFDALLPLCREKWFWAPLYLFIGAFTLLNFPKRGWVILFGLVLVVVLSDGISSELVKKNIRRLRPCNDPTLAATVRLRTHCGSGYSFTSSHAANHFAVAVFLIGVFGRLHRRLRPAVLFWAGLIAFSQVYVGVHYPGDVLGGALLGMLIGWWVAWLVRRWVVLPSTGAGAEP